MGDSHLNTQCDPQWYSPTIADLAFNWVLLGIDLKNLRPTLMCQKQMAYNVVSTSAIASGLEPTLY